MPDTITVTFGGREVVLAKVQDHRLMWEIRWGLRVLRIFRFGSFDYDAEWTLEGCTVRGWGESAQSAVSAVESRLRDLVRQINEVLGP